jgi:hypothetical protein
VLTKGCAFDEATHSYAMEGRSVPSVTRVLDHAGLVSYDMVKREILERKSTIGTLVHTATHYYDIGDLDWSSLDEHTKGRTEAWVSFRTDTGFVPRIIEEPYIATIHGMNYGLKIDREGLMHGQEAIVEIKNAATAEAWWAIQTAGYALGVPDGKLKNNSPRTLFARRRRLAVQLFPDGRYKKHDFTDFQDAEVFISSLHIALWKLNHGSPLRRIEE